MKFIASICAVVLVSIALYLRGPNAPDELHQDYQLPPGKINPPLRRVGISTPIPTGAHLWFRTNRTSYARVLDDDPAHDFFGQHAPATLIQARSGTQWVPRSALNSSWTEK